MDWILIITVCPYGFKHGMDIFHGRFLKQVIMACTCDKTTSGLHDIDGVFGYPAYMFLCALDFAFGPSYEVVIVGNPDSDDLKNMFDALRKAFVPNKVLIYRKTETGTFETDSLAPYTASMTAIDEKTTAYVCRNFACELPTTEIEKMLEKLGVDNGI